MIYKNREIPKKLYGLHALIRRLPSSFEDLPRFKEEYKNIKAGFGGEENFDHHVLEFKPNYPHAILHDICLNQNGVFFQMDSILITPAFIVIFEVKNIAGKLIFSENPAQFVRQLDNGETRAMKSPIAELERKRYLLSEWLRNHGINLPIKCVVAHAYPNVLEPVSIPGMHITFAYQIPNYLYGLSIDNERLHHKQIELLARKITENHHEYNPFPLIKTMNIPRNAILPGVICPDCNALPMRWMKRKWVCVTCKYVGMHHHVEAISDWFCLIDNKITNRELRNFIEIKDPQIAKRFLTKTGMTLKGKSKGSFYEMNTEMILNHSTLHIS